MEFALTAATKYWARLRFDDPPPVHVDCLTPLKSIGDQEWACAQCGVSGGLLTPTSPNTSSDYTQSVLEAASWRLASQLTLRHRDLRIERAYPHPGTSDVLVIRPFDAHPTYERGPTLFLDRDYGRIHLIRRADDIEPEGGPWRWDEYLTKQPAPLIERIEHAAGLFPAAHPGEPSTEAVMYSIIADLAAAAVFEEPMNISAGFESNSGYSDWWHEMETRAPEEIGVLDGDINAASTRFWRIERSDFLLTVDVATGMAWADGYDPQEVEALGYDEFAAKLPDLTGPRRRLSRTLDMAMEMGRLT
ncbi:MAG: hypothetical protein Q7J48_04820 [Nocardioides sp.]|nr:hypothetical protein [Nocardioides sp.]